MYISPGHAVRTTDAMPPFPAFPLAHEPVKQGTGAILKHMRSRCIVAWCAIG